jgi:hypothetical protein
LSRSRTDRSLLAEVLAAELPREHLAALWVILDDAKTRRYRAGHDIIASAAERLQEETEEAYVVQAGVSAETLYAEVQALLAPD